jgi:hypothetical protein
VLDAYKQFHETEDWRKANHLDDLYETIDIEHYEETRRLVRFLSQLQHAPTSNTRSIPNGPAAVTVAEYPFTSSKSNI